MPGALHHMTVSFKPGGDQRVTCKAHIHERHNRVLITVNKQHRWLDHGFCREKIRRQ